MGINRAIARLGRLFAILFVVLALRQLVLQVVPNPQLTTDAHDPRASLLEPYRGTIVARDGTVLAASGQRGRTYPLGRSLAHAVGYVSPRYGTAGIEAAFDNDLAPRPVANDPVAQLRGAFDARFARPQRGATVVTTIDPAVQAVLFEGLSQYGRAAGVVLDPRTGEVLALASVPSFDPGGIDREFASLLTDTRSPLLDRALDGLYPPGSTFKIVTAAAALDAGVVTLQSTFEDPGTLPVGTFVVHDNEGEATGEQDLTGAFALSSNVDFADIALRLGAKRWAAQAARWQLGAPVDFTLPVTRDRVPARAELASDGVLAQLGFGQADLLVTPMRMALVAATVASGGTMPRPYLVRAVRDGGHERTAASAVVATPISPEIASAVRSMMVATVARGTGTAAALPGITVAGKTGTATNAAGTAHAWFVAFAPAESPRVAVAIVVEHGGYGGAVAAPIAKHVIAAALRRTKS